jgi:hypothetical protein
MVVLAWQKTLQKRKSNYTPTHGRAFERFIKEIAKAGPQHRAVKKKRPRKLNQRRSPANEPGFLVVGETHVGCST